MCEDSLVQELLHLQCHLIFYHLPLLSTRPFQNSTYIRVNADLEILQKPEKANEFENGH